MAENSGISANKVHICLGMVIDTVSGARWYNVRTGANADIPCSAMHGSSTSQTVGTKQISVYPPGTHVIVMLPIDGHGAIKPPGYIIGAITMPVGSSSYRILDLIGLQGGGNAATEDVHRYIPVKQPTSMRDYNVGMPFDAVPGSDVGHMNELGVGAGVSRFFSWSCASELAGVWSFYLDNLTRLAAYNYEFWHSGGERWIKNDEGEVNDVDMFTPYPWEASGVLKAATEAFKAIKGGGIYSQDQQQFPYEPQVNDQSIIPRWMRLRGYLGDMHREMVVLPIIVPEDYSKTNSTFVEKLSQKTKYTGVLDVHQHASGLFSVRSAQGIVLEKYIYIPVPKQMNAPEQTDDMGDGATNYSPSGIWGLGEDAAKVDHDKTPWSWSTDDPTLWAAELYDYSAYMFNWYGIKPVLAHKKDWWVQDEGFFANQKLTTDAAVAPAIQGSPTGLSGAYIPKKALSESFTFPLPQFASIKIDHRTGDTKYFYSRSVIAQLPDGSVLIEDGYGSSLHMAGGNMYLSGAGDVWIKPGRSIVMWAGDDLIARAGSSIDITSSNADVRLKAEKNLHMLGGNSGVAGGVIIESRSNIQGGSFRFKDGDTALVGEDVTTFGIMLKAPKAPVMIYGNDIYGRAIAQGGTGGITFEADTDVVISGTELTSYAVSGLTQIIGQSLGTGATVSGDSIVNRFDKLNTVFSSTKLFRAMAEVAVLDSEGGVYAHGPLAVTQGLVPFPSSSVATVISGFTSDYTSWLTSDLGQLTEAYYTETYEMGVKSNADFMEQSGFTCRNAQQYGLTADFKLAEARWQQVYRAADLGMLWTEPAVAIPGGTGLDLTRPHPGNEYWSTASVYVEYDPDLWKWKTSAGGTEWALKNTARNFTDGANSPYAKAVAARAGDLVPDAVTLNRMSENYIVSSQVTPT